MAHPFNQFRNHMVQKTRVPKIAGPMHSGASHSDAAADKELIRKMVKPTAMRADGGAVRHRADRPARANGGSVPTPKPRPAGKEPGPSDLYSPADQKRLENQRARGGRVKGTTVNVIVAPKQNDMPAAPPMAAMPPPMPPKPPMAMPAPVPPMGVQSGLGGMPPMPPRSDGGRAYKRGGAVSDSSKGGTQVQHSGNKSDAQNIGRKAVITKATGGAIYSDGRKGKQMAWLKGVGAGGGEGRLKKARHEKSA